MLLNKRELLATGLGAGALSGLASLANAQTLDPRVAPPRTLEELKAEVLRRVANGGYPGVGIRLGDAQRAMAELKSAAPDEWARAWIAAGDATAGEAKRTADPGPRRDLYRAAFNAYSMGRFPAPVSPGKREAYRKALAAYLDYARLVPQRLEIVRIPFEGKEIVGYYRAPDGPGPFALMVQTGGLDYLKEQVADEGLSFLPHGIAVFAIDMPGTGQSPVLANVGSERIFSRVLDWAERRPEIDRRKMIMRGVSWGGHWATRVAIVEKDRLIGANNHGGPVHYFFQREWQLKALGTREYLLDLFAGRSAVYGVKTLDAFLDYGPRMSLLDNGMIDRASAPMLVINGAQDTQVPIADQLLLLQHGDAKHAFINPHGGHMATGGGWTSPRINAEVVIPWMKRRIASVA